MVPLCHIFACLCPIFAIVSASSKISFRSLAYTIFAKKIKSMTIEKNQRTLAQLSATYRPGTLNLIGGRPGMGKTTMAFHLATEAHTIHNGESNKLDDGFTWAEGPLRIPQFEHICVCYLVHAFCTHLRYSIPDLLRMTTYICERSMWEMSEAEI